MGKPRIGPVAAICLLFPSAVMAYGITGFNSGVGYHPWLIPGVLTILLFAALARCTPLRLRPVLNGLLVLYPRFSPVTGWSRSSWVSCHFEQIVATWE